MPTILLPEMVLSDRSSSFVPLIAVAIGFVLAAGSSAARVADGSSPSEPRAASALSASMTGQDSVRSKSERHRPVRRPGRAGRLVWSDEFNGVSIDRTIWEHQLGDGSAYDLPPGWGNNELQVYTDRAENSFVADGFLHIVVRREGEGSEGPFTSARLRTRGQNELRYGRFEARLKLPSGKGLWPAFWMLPNEWAYGGWAASGEIDIVESVNAADVAYGTIHFGGVWPDHRKSGGSYAAPENLSESFHVYAVEWEPDEIRWYVDEICYHRVTSAGWYSDGAPGDERAPFDRSFHLLLNVAIGGNWPGSPDESTALPQEMLVDWIRVWELDDSGTASDCGRFRRD